MQPSDVSVAGKHGGKHGCNAHDGRQHLGLEGAHAARNNKVNKEKSQTTAATSRTTDAEW